MDKGSHHKLSLAPPQCLWRNANISPIRVRQHFAKFAQNASICANGETYSKLMSKSTVPGQFLRVWIRNVAHTGLNDLMLFDLMCKRPLKLKLIRPAGLVRKVPGALNLSKIIESRQFRQLTQISAF
jgi:hypothetical protein